ncbi:hypothetical protein BSR04_17100 [Serratia plymuthica]|nr:hypothetical protein BSR04_17100 [Serratia plymuthica]
MVASRVGHQFGPCAAHPDPVAARGAGGEVYGSLYPGNRRAFRQIVAYRAIPMPLFCALSDQIQRFSLKLRCSAQIEAGEGKEA